MSLRKNYLTEDWTVVVLGLLSIGIILFFYNIPAPVYNWGSKVDFFESILVPKNIQHLLVQFMYVFLISILGFYLPANQLST